MSFQSFEELEEICQNTNRPLWKVIQEEDAFERKVEVESSLEAMKKIWEAIVGASKNYDGTLYSKSGLVGGEGAKMKEYYARIQEPLCGNYLSKVVEEALKMAESNACMKRIVAAPTAGSCGVLPAVLVPYQELKQVDDEKILESLYVAAGIGQIIVERASISGAEGGCQAEIGSASSMAAGAICYLEGGSNHQIYHAAAIAMKSVLGLVCDPVAGLVEVPCVKRNVMGAVNAVTSAEMALAGVESKIPPDQVIDAMKEIGDKMDVSLKETAKGGLAATPFGVSQKEIVKNNMSSQE